jgi:ABC-type multidrug transport system fused ATPase/permease subunit
MLKDGKFKNSIAHVLSAGVHHSMYYHRRYEGWMEQLVEKDGGKKRIERVYVGEYYSQDLSARQGLLIRFLYFVLYTLSSAFFLIASIRFTGSNRTFVVQFICFLTLLCLIALFIFLCAYALSPKRMTVWEYYAGPSRVRTFSFITALLMGGNVAAVFMFILTADNADVQSEIVNIAAYLAVLVLMFVLYRVEKSIRYEVTASSAKEIRSGYYID